MINMVGLINNIKELNIKDMHLWTSGMSITPIYYPFSEKEYGTEWELGVKLDDDNIEQEEEEFFPLQNYFYRLPEFESKMEDFTDEEIREILDKSGNVTLIEIKEEDGDMEYYIGLTGYGMDFSWDIITAYINFGYFPPNALTLPDMANLMNDDRRKIIEIVKLSYEKEIEFMKYKKERLDVVLESMEKYTKEYYEREKENEKKRNKEEE